MPHSCVRRADGAGHHVELEAPALAAERILELVGASP